MYSKEVKIRVKDANVRKKFNYSSHCKAHFKYLDL